MKVELVPIELIKVGDRFRKDLGTEEEVAELKKSILEKGLIQPITVDQNYNLVAGGRRLYAYKQLNADLHIGMTEIDCVIRDVKDELDAREIELFENIHRKAMTWSEEAIAIDAIRTLYIAEDPLEMGKATQTSIAKETGKSRPTISKKLAIAEMLRIVPTLIECKTEDEAWKKYKQLQAQLIVKQLRNEQEVELEAEIEKDPEHIIRRGKFDFAIGDALHGMEDLINRMEALSLPSKLVFAEVDPPYGIDLKNMKKRTSDDIDDALEAYNEIEAEDYTEFLRASTKLVYNCLAENAWCIWWYGSSWHSDVKIALAVAGFKFDSIPAIWYKGAGQTMNPEILLARTYEPFFVCRKGTPSLKQRGHGNVFEYSGLHSSKKHHPTEKPLDLMMELLSVFTLPGDKMIVPFLGSGVTLRAGYIMNVRGFGWELNERNKDEFLVKVEEDEFEHQEAKRQKG